MNFSLENLQSLLVSYGLNVLWAIVILLIGRWLAGLFTGMLKKGLSRAEVDPGLTSFLGTLVYYAILTFVIIAALARVGVQTTSIIAVLGVSVAGRTTDPKIEKRYKKRPNKITSVVIGVKNNLTPKR